MLVLVPKNRLFKRIAGDVRCVAETAPPYIFLNNSSTSHAALVLSYKPIQLTGPSLELFRVFSGYALGGTPTPGSHMLHWMTVLDQHSRSRLIVDMWFKIF
jgi:hypothetical protein